MNICIFSRSFSPNIGGLEVIAEIVANEAVALGHAVEVLTDTVAPLGYDHGRPFFVTRTSSLVERWKAIARADAVLFMNISLVGVPLALLLRRTVVASHHGCYEGQGFRGKVLEGAKRNLTRLFKNISCSHFVAGRLPGHSIVVPNAYDRNLFRLRANVNREADFLFCGRLVSDKGCALLLHSFAKVLDLVPDSRLTVVGDGPERVRLTNSCMELGIEKSVQFRGALRGEALVEEYRRHRCLVVPSLWEEPFGIVALEGIACCETVVVMRRGGLPEAVGACGIVVEPTSEGLAQALIRIAQARAMGLSLPGAPSAEVREQHLLRHHPKTVGAAYLQAIAEAA